MDIRRSIVKWFDAKKGYGFIVHPDDGSDVFVHYSQIKTDRRFKTLRTGEEVEFELNDGPKGLHAHNVVSLSPLPEEEDQRPKHRAAHTNHAPAAAAHASSHATSGMPARSVSDHL